MFHYWFVLNVFNTSFSVLDIFWGWFLFKLLYCNFVIAYLIFVFKGDNFALLVPQWRPLLRSLSGDHYASLVPKKAFHCVRDQENISLDSYQRGALGVCWEMPLHESCQEAYTYLRLCQKRLLIAFVPKKVREVILLHLIQCLNLNLVKRHILIFSCAKWEHLATFVPRRALSCNWSKGEYFANI